MRHAELKKPVSEGELCRRCDLRGNGINLDRRGMKWSTAERGKRLGSALVLDHPAGV
jgi:hypothetical protein